MYNEYFGLRQAPFRITPDTALFYTGGSRGDVLDALVYAITSGEGIVKVVGEVGTGKTMLCRMLEERLPDNVQIAYLANPSLTPEDILHAVALELGLDVASDANRLQVMHRLQETLLARHANNQRVVVLVEEAQSMPVNTLEEIRLLSNLETKNEKLLQIVLFGQPELDENLAQAQIRQLRERITHSFALTPLGREEVKDYVAFRLRASGYRGRDAFTADAYRAMSRASEGLTRRVNIIADKAMLAAFADDTHDVSAKHVRSAIADSEFNSKRGRNAQPRLIAMAAVAVAVAGTVGWYAGSHTGSVAVFADHQLPFQSPRSASVHRSAAVAGTPAQQSESAQQRAAQASASPEPQAPVAVSAPVPDGDAVAPAATSTAALVAASTPAESARGVVSTVLASVAAPSESPNVDRIATVAKPSANSMAKPRADPRAVRIDSAPRVDGASSAAVSLPPALSTVDPLPARPVQSSAVTVSDAQPREDAASVAAAAASAAGSITAPASAAATLESSPQPVQESDSPTDAGRVDRAATAASDAQLEAGVGETAPLPAAIAMLAEDRSALPSTAVSPRSSASSRNSEPRPAAASFGESRPESLLQWRLAHTRQWLRSASKNHYTIQLLATTADQGDELEDFLSRRVREGHIEKVFVYQTSIKSREWYGVLFGDFAGYSRAREELRDLPPELRLQKPFVRNIKDINALD